MFFVPARARGFIKKLPIFVSTLLSLLFLLPSLTMSAELLTLLEAERIALSSEPGQVRLQAHSTALLEQAAAAGQLPDPQLRVGLMNVPVESGGLRTEGMSQAQLGIRQAFPPGRTLQWRTTELERKAQVLDSLSGGRGRDVATLTRLAWLDVYFWTRSHSLVSETTPLLQDLVEVTRALYSVGRKDQQDLLRAELELSRLTDRLLSIDQSIGDARSALARWVGSADAQRPVGPSLPAWSEIPPLEQLKTQLDSYPALQAATGEVAVRAAGVGLAKQKFKPGWAIDVGYGYRDGRLPNGEPRSDFLSLMVSFDLPVFQGKRQNRVLAAAKNEQRASVMARTELYRQLLQDLGTTHQRWREISRRLALYERVILDQAANQSEAAMKAYQSDTADFADVMRALISELEVKLDYHRLEVDRDRNYVQLAKLGGLL